ncbi:hypothetical protein K523DRAFT_372778 [Schizophyllum commune Tattone D]|nr:hypothetical protein K523DRAFT_372778 [Schizophyllum commune Tattone D]
MQNTSDYRDTHDEPEPLELSEEEFALLLRLFGHDTVTRLLEVPPNPHDLERVAGVMLEVPSADYALSPEEWDACHSAIMRMTAAGEVELPPPANFGSSSEAAPSTSEAPAPDQSCSQPLPRPVVSTVPRRKAATARRKDPNAHALPCTWSGCEATFHQAGQSERCAMAKFQKHLMSHENKQEYKCTVASCEKRFNTLRLLRSHLLNAHKEKASGLES